MTIALLISVALLAGIFAGLTGAGGGLILVPLLVFMGYSALESVATSNIAVMISAISATVMNSRDHDLPWRRILLLALPALILAPVGAIIASRTPEIALLIAFCALNIVNIYLLGKRSRLADTTDATDVGNVARSIGVVGVTTTWAGRFTFRYLVRIFATPPRSVTVSVGVYEP